MSARLATFAKTCATACALLLALASSAQAWDLFRSRSSPVERGNEALAKGQHKEALEAYDEAARELPNDPAVQLDRGLALLGLDRLGEAREALRRAGSASAPKEVRGPALYDLGLAFMKEADLAGKSEDLDGAKKMLEESVDAFRGSLRAQPNNADAAWNLELAKRRLVDNEQKREEKKKQDEQKKDENKDQQNKDQQNKDQQNKDQQDKDQQRPDAGSDPGGDAGAPKPNEQQGEPNEQNDQRGQDASQPEPPDQGDAGQAPEPQPAEQKPEPPPQQPEASELPEHMKRALDALEAGEENLEKQRARQRARQRPRRIEKDW
jgi:Ca-activated chloride channel family protein